MTRSKHVQNQIISNVPRLLVGLTGTLLLVVFSAAYAATAMVWSQYDEPNVNVYYSPDGERALALSASGIHVLPNLFKTAESTWICWVDKSSTEQNRLMYALLDANSTILEMGSMPTENGHIYAPAIAFDSDAQRAWLVWAENNGRREILYASYRDMGKRGTGTWQPALQITENDQYSSNLPVIDEVFVDGIRISWMRSSPASTQTAEAEISINEWISEAPTGDDRQGRTTLSGASKPHYGKLRTQGLNEHDHLIKRLDRTASPSEAELAWKKKVSGKKVLTGAIHSGNGQPERLAVGAKQ